MGYALRETLKLKDVEKSKLEVFPSIKLLIKRWHEELKGYALRETPSLEDVKESEQKSTQIKPPIKKWYSEQQATDEKPRHDRSLSERGDILLGKEELVSKAVLSNFKLMDRLKNYLDKSVRGIKNWRMLAYLHGFRKEQLIWRLGEKYSRSEMMFEALICENPNLLMTTLAQHLEALNINDVADYIVALKLSVKETVAEFFEFQNLNNTGKVLEMLDLIEEDKWWRLGIKIEVDDRMLKRISIECGNRQHELRGDVIDVILASHPFDTIQQLKDDFEGMAPWEIYSILRELLGELTSDELPYSEYFWEIARMIRYSFFSEVGALPAVYEISREAYEGLQLLFAISPTQKTIEAIVKHDPNFTVGQLFMDLSYMGRLDVIKAISPNYEWK